MEINLENIKSKMDPKIKHPSSILYKLKKPSEFLLPHFPPLFQCILNKKQKILKNEKSGIYHFYDDKCLYFDASKKILLKGVFFFHCNARIEFIKGNSSKKTITNNKIIGIRISKNHSEKDFYSKDEFLLQKIHNFLRKRIFQTNFHQNYKALKQLGKGNFATVLKKKEK